MGLSSEPRGERGASRGSARVRLFPATQRARRTEARASAKVGSSLAYQATTMLKRPNRQGEDRWVVSRPQPTSVRGYPVPEPPLVRDPLAPPPLQRLVQQQHRRVRRQRGMRIHGPGCGGYRSPPAFRPEQPGPSRWQSSCMSMSVPLASA